MLEKQQWYVRTIFTSIAALTLLTIGAATVNAKIICWKDAAGKVIGCGDRVPPEFQKNETKRLDERGITRGTSVSAEEAARLKEEEKKKAALKAAEDQRLAEQKRQDTALINTYTSAKEIDRRGERELQVVDLQIQQLKNAVKGSVDAHNAQKSRYASFEKRGKIPDNVKDDLKRAADEENRIKARIAGKEKDKERIAASYAQQKARFIELRGGPPAAPVASKPAAAKK